MKRNLLIAAIVSVVMSASAFAATDSVKLKPAVMLGAPNVQEHMMQVNHTPDHHVRDRVKRKIHKAERKIHRKFNHAHCRLHPQHRHCLHR